MNAKVKDSSNMIIDVEALAHVKVNTTGMEYLFFTLNETRDTGIIIHVASIGDVNLSREIGQEETNMIFDMMKFLVASNGKINDPNISFLPITEEVYQMNGRKRFSVFAETKQKLIEVQNSNMSLDMPLEETVMENVVIEEPIDTISLETTPVEETSINTQNNEVFNAFETANGEKQEPSVNAMETENVNEVLVDSLNEEQPYEPFGTPTVESIPVYSEADATVSTPVLEENTGYENNASAEVITKEQALEALRVLTSYFSMNNDVSKSVPMDATLQSESIEDEYIMSSPVVENEETQIMMPNPEDYPQYTETVFGPNSLR